MNKQKRTKIIAKLIKWNGTIIRQEIKREWIDDIISAIQGQFTIVNNLQGFMIKGSDYSHVDIYEVVNDID